MVFTDSAEKAHSLLRHPRSQIKEKSAQQKALLTSIWEMVPLNFRGRGG
jgi:hypothetical protein